MHGTQPGVANDDIDHVGYLLRARDRVGALINLLLTAPEQRVLVFVRTRLATSEVAIELSSAGFSAAALSGDIGQRERTATLDAFRANAVHILVATDVAARGLDIADVGRVVHFDPPDNSEAFTHRSGRTGRAGNMGTSVMFVPPSGQGRVEYMLRRADVRIAWERIPTPKQIRCAADDRLVEQLAAGIDVEEPRLRQVAARLLEQGDAVEVVAALLSRSDHVGPCEPRSVQAVTPGRRGVEQRAPRRGNEPRSARQHEEFTSFHVTWGTNHGATTSRMLAMVCRRGGVKGNSIGAIRVGPFHSMVDVASIVAEEFARAASRPDRRNPQVKIRHFDPNKATKRRP